MSDKKGNPNVTLVDSDGLSPSSSFELNKTSRGVNIRVKIYASDSHDEVSHAMNEAMSRFDSLLEKYGV